MTTRDKKSTNKDSTIGPIIGSLIILVILIAGALYYWGQRLSESKARKTALDKATMLNQTIKYFGTSTEIISGTSTNPADIEKDLNSTL